MSENRAKTPDLSVVEAEARQLLDARMDAVRELARARQEVADRDAALRDAEAADKAAFTAATTAGWTPEELRRVGLGQLPSAGGRPRRRGTSAGSTTRRTTNTSATTPPTTSGAGEASGDGTGDTTGDRTEDRGQQA